MRTLGAYEIGDARARCWEAVDEEDGYLATFESLERIVVKYPDDRILVFSYESFEAAQLAAGDDFDGRAPEPDRTIEPRGGRVKTTEDLFSLKLWKSRQALEGEALAVTSDERRLRARVKRDAYDEQSFAIVECWTTAQGWDVVTRTPIAETHVFEFSYYGRAGRDDELWREAIGLDLLKLLTEAEALFLS